VNKKSWRALLWSLFCPGIGEWRLGYRALGLVFTIVFAVLCVWLLVSAYTLVYGLAELVKSRDPSLATPVSSAGDAAATSLRLFLAIHREYMTQRAALHDKLWYPLWAIAVVYFWSMGQAWVLGSKADRETSKDATAG
jgi:hypothetical protein